MQRVVDDGILTIATALAALGVGGLIVGELKAARAEGGHFSPDLGWTLLWALSLSVLFAAGWVR